MSYIYLASPYSDDDPWVRQHRYEVVLRANAQLLQDGHMIYCPIAATHDLAVKYEFGYLQVAWDNLNRAMLEPASELWICMMDGWEESKGVKREIDIAKENEIPIRYLTYTEGRWRFTDETRTESRNGDEASGPGGHENKHS
jgi:hypothetical protein